MSINFHIRRNVTHFFSVVESTTVSRFVSYNNERSILFQRLQLIFWVAFVRQGMLFHNASGFSSRQAEADRRTFMSLISRFFNPRNSKGELASLVSRSTAGSTVIPSSQRSSEL
jgi:hypothetical protein